MIVDLIHWFLALEPWQQFMWLYCPLLIVAWILAPLFLLAFGLVRWAAWFLFYKLPSMALDGARRQDPLPPPDDKS